MALPIEKFTSKSIDYDFSNEAWSTGGTLAAKCTFRKPFYRAIPPAARKA
jgi:hypothetical protein